MQLKAQKSGRITLQLVMLGSYDQKVGWKIPAHFCIQMK